jgi:hypothetical protein
VALLHAGSAVRPSCAGHACRSSGGRRRATLSAQAIPREQAMPPNHISAWLWHAGHSRLRGQVQTIADIRAAYRGMELPRRPSIELSRSTRVTSQPARARRMGSAPGRHRDAGDAAGVGGDRLDLAAHRAPRPPPDVVELGSRARRSGVGHGRLSELTERSEHAVAQSGAEAEPRSVSAASSTAWREVTRQAVAVPACPAIGRAASSMIGLSASGVNFVYVACREPAGRVASSGPAVWLQRNTRGRR